MSQENPPHNPESDDKKVQSNTESQSKTPEEIKHLGKKFTILGAIKSAIIGPDPKDAFYKGKLEAKYDMSPEAVSKRLDEELEKKHILRNELEMEAIDKVRMLFAKQNTDVSERIIELLANRTSMEDVIHDLGTEAVSRPVTSTDEYKHVASQVVKALKMIVIPV